MNDTYHSSSISTGEGSFEVSSQNRSLRKALTTRYAVALYMSSVLGSGILVLPGLAAQVAGPGSLIAWVGLSLASYPLAYTFASLSARRPESGGVYGFARESLGPRTANAVGWLFILWYASGAPVVTVIAASYLDYAIPIGRTLVYIIAGAIMLAAFLVNYRGIIVSSRIQLAIITAILGLLITAVLASAPYIRPASFGPFLPNGLIPIGTSAALIFWSYLGYENVSNVAEEFKNPEKDFQRSILYSVMIISTLYTSVAIATIGSQAYKAGGSIAPFAAMLSDVLGTYGAIGTAILAIIIIFSTANVYTTGISRVIYATAKQGGLPKMLDRVHSKTLIPHRTLMLLLGLSWLTLTIFYVFHVDIETGLLIPSGAAILVYIIGSMSGIRLLRISGFKKVFPWISLLISLTMIIFVGVLVLISLAFAATGFAYMKWDLRQPRDQHTSTRKKYNKSQPNSGLLMVVVVSNRIPVKKAYEDVFEERWKNRKWTIANHPGFIKTEVMKPVKGDYYLVVTHWQSMKDFENWTNSDAFIESHSNALPREAFSGPSQLEIHEVIAER